MADELNREYGVNEIDEVTDGEVVDVPSVTRKPIVTGTLAQQMNERRLVIIVNESASRKCVEEKQRNQMNPELIAYILQNTVVAQEVVMNNIMDKMETEGQSDLKSSE